MIGRRLGLVALGVLALVAIPARRADAHAGLVFASPAANSTLTTPPRELRLRFSEAIEVSLSALELVDEGGVVMRLSARADPRDARTLLARLPALRPGGYHVRWRVVSADGHASHGRYGFTLAGAAGAAAVPAGGTVAGAPGRAQARPADAAEEGEQPASAPAGVGLLRGLAVLALLVAAGVLGLASWAAAPTSLPAARRLGAWLTAAAAALLVGDAIAWAAYATGGGPDRAGPGVLLATVPGGIVAARLVLVLLALWAAGLARRTGLGATFALAAVAAGAAVGHPAGVHPFLAVPLQAVHLLAVAAWLGGVVLLLLSLMDPGGSAAAAGRVSALALASAVAVGLTGVLLALLFLGRPADLLDTAYGRLVLAKAAGLAVLLCFGALHRARFIPRLRRGEARPIRSALRLELGVFALVVLVAGLLSYTPLPAESGPAAGTAGAASGPE